MTDPDQINRSASQQESGGGRYTFASDFTSSTPEHYDSRELTARDLGMAAGRPRSRWHRTLRWMTGTEIHNQSIAGEPGSRRLDGSARQAVSGTRSIAVLSLKGGVGKTTTTVGLGATLALTRGDRVIAVDANPDFGTLAQRGPNDCNSTVRTLLADNSITRYSDVRRHTSQGPNRLEFLGSERDPAVSESFSESDYRAVHDILDRYYNIILTDCGTGLTHSVTKGVLDTANALIVVGSPSIDSARSVLATIDWLNHHGYAHLVPDATVVLSSVWSEHIPIDVNPLSEHFERRVRRTVIVPYDNHLAEGGEISLELLSRQVRQAYAEITGSLAAAFDASYSLSQ